MKPVQLIEAVGDLVRQRDQASRDCRYREQDLEQARENVRRAQERLDGLNRALERLVLGARGRK